MTGSERSSFARARAIGSLALLLAMLAVPAPGPAAASGFVTRSGSRLVVDGKLWRAIGVNLWDLDGGKAQLGDLSGCYYQHVDLDDYFGKSFAAIARNTHATV